MKISVLSAVVLSASVIAAPLMAEEIKPIQPKASTQAETALVLGALTQVEIALLAAAGLAVGTAVANGGSSSSTPVTAD